MIGGIQPDQIDATLPILMPWLRNIESRASSRWTVEDMIADLRSGHLQAWLCGSMEALALTRTYPDCVVIVACTGKNRDHWADDLEATIAAWAKANGKKKLIIECRPGWSPWLKGKGYRETHREMTRAL